MNLKFEEEIGKMKDAFSITRKQMLDIAAKLKDDMENKKYLMMLPSKLYCDKSAGEGKFISLDFGNTNVRICIYHLDGKGKYELVSKKEFALNSKDCNYLSGDYELVDIFAEIAKCIRQMVNPNEHYYLGHSFSRAFVSEDINHATTTKFSSNFKVKNVKGYDINDTLYQVLKMYELNVEPVCVINDTTAVLVGGRYLHPNVDMSCIIGTGYNMGMIDGTGQVINTECGAFSDFSLNCYDEKYVIWRNLPKDECSLMNVFVAPGQKAAIMASLVMEEFVGKGLIEPIDLITPEVLSASLKGEFNENLSVKQKIFLKEVAEAIYSRGAKLVATGIYAILDIVDCNLANTHGVMFEGSTVANVPYLDYLKDALTTIYGEDAYKVECYFEKDVAILGAAVAASIASKS